MKNLRNIAGILPIFAILILTMGLRAQTDGVDSTYAPIVAGATPAAPFSESVQPDGKLIVTGTFSIVNGLIKPIMVRLNTDGSVDPSFNCAVCTTFDVAGTAVQTDGKIVVVGRSDPNLRQPIVMRLNPDGSRDSFYVNGMTGSGQHGVIMPTIALDGKAYVVGYQVGTFLDSRTLYRLNTDGTRDTSFTPFSMNQWHSGAYFGGLNILPDGRLFFYGKSQYGYLAQLNNDGSKNTSFEGPTLTPPPDQSPFPVQAFINSFGMQSDGKSVFTGMFITVNGISKEWVARLNTDGGLDTGYSPLPAFTNSNNRIVKIYAGDKTLFARSDTVKKLIRNNPDGSVDNTYSAPNELTSVSRWQTLQNDKLLVYGVYNGVSQYVRLNADGSVDPFFTSPTFEREGSVARVTVQADGKAVIAGNFAKVGGMPRAGVARLNADGTLDTAFDPGAGAGFDGTVNSLAVQADGKVIAGGNFNGYNGGSQAGLVRFNANGSLDSGFDPVILPAGSVLAVAVRADGKILVGGTINFVDSTARTKIALLNSDGSLDTAFNPLLGGTNPDVRALFVQTDGKIMIGGFFSGVNGFNRTNIARLNADGTLDTAFNAGSVSIVSYVSRLGDGKYLVASNGLRRLNSDGTADGTFTPTTTTSFSAVLPLQDGTVLYSSGFGLGHLFANGAVDNFFVPASANADIRTLAIQPDGKALVGGDFTKLGSSIRTSLARIAVAAFYRSTMFDFDGDRKADFMVTRPSNYNWHLLTNGTYIYTETHFGTTGDRVVPADYDGDGKTDIAIWRPSTGDWWVKASSTGNFISRNLGVNGDTPIPSDTDGNGKADFVVVTPGGLWKGIDVATGTIIVSYQFSSPGDKPVTGDFDGDGKSDLAYFRPSNGTWYYNKSSSGANLELGIVQWGLSTDIPAPADYDGDGKTDLAVYRPSEGNWYVLNSGGGYLMVHFGATGDKPIPADYDGDGKADIAVFRPSDGYWYQLLTTGGYTGLPWGIGSDIPAPNALLPSADPPRAVSSIGRK